MITSESEVAALRALIAKPADWSALFYCREQKVADDFALGSEIIFPAKQYRVRFDDHRGLYVVERRTRA